MTAQLGGTTQLLVPSEAASGFHTPAGRAGAQHNAFKRVQEGVLAGSENTATCAISVTA